MSNPINDGGSAFPCEQGRIPDGTWNQAFEPGISLRDWFAGMALQGMMAYHNPARGDFHYNCNDEEIANTAYNYSDAMLAARKEGGEA